MFFFEKKNQKTFVRWCALPASLAPSGKSFLLLFFKKEGLPFLGHAMSFCRIALAIGTVLVATPLSASTDPIDPLTIWGHICTSFDGQRSVPQAWANRAVLPVAKCHAAPTVYQPLASIGGGGDARVSLEIGYDADTQRLCFLATGLSTAPVLRVGVGHALSVRIRNTLHDTGHAGQKNCPIDSFGGEGLCFPKPVFVEAPGADGPFYPLMANEAHMSDGTSNLHVHGLFVSPQACSDEVLNSTIYPANWVGPVGAFPPCQSAPDTLTYTYTLPADHPAGLYWYHTHRHGEAEHETQMGLAGAIVVEDAGDAWRRSIGVTDEVLVVTDTPKTGCLIGVGCDIARAAAVKKRQTDAPAAREAAREAATASDPVLDPRIDQVDQAGECAQGATSSAGGIELWTLELNGAPVPEDLAGFPQDSELLTKTMQPGQRQIFRMVNASANSFLAPQLVLSLNGVQTVQPLEVFARDGVGLADAAGRRHFGLFDVTKTQFVVAPAARVEFVVHAPPAGAKLYLESAQVNPGCGGNLYPARRLLLITPAGAAVDPGAADDSDLLEHTPSLAPYLATLGTAPSVQRTFVLAEYGRDFTYGVTKWLSGPPTVAQYDPTQTDFYITEVASTDGEVQPQLTAMKPFVHTPAPQVVVHLHGQQSVTEDWLIENSTLEIHAFHMHQIHFRDVSSPGNNPDLHPLLDVITVPAAPLIGNVATGYPGAPGWVKLRMTFTTADIGEFVFHCHILEHEDNGMMGKVRVVAD
jgi:FtsP/CotA-like multicopper oxidase with cupredoxin domain